MSSLLLLVAASGPLTGCDTTEAQSARAKLQANRLLAARALPSVRRAAPHVRVLRVLRVETVLGRRRGAAFVVTLRNTGRVTATDLPLLVGLGSPSRPLAWPNRRRGQDYFATHVPAIAPGATATWVWTTARRTPLTTRAFARAGRSTGVTRAPAGALPELRVRLTGRTARTVLARVENLSGVPQYTPQIYAVVRRGQRVTAAGRASLVHLGTHRSGDVVIHLAGPGSAGRISLEAVPTIFH